MDDYLSSTSTRRLPEIHPKSTRQKQDKEQDKEQDYDKPETSKKGVISV